MADMMNLWEDYRKQARQLENEIDLKLVSFSKLETNYSSQHDFSDTSPLLNKSGSEHMFETMAMEIKQLLSKNGRIHTEYYMQEFHKTKANITAIRERDDLLGSVQRDISAYINSSGLNRRTEMYLKEHEHIRKYVDLSTIQFKYRELQVLLLPEGGLEASVLTEMAADAIGWISRESIVTLPCSA